MAASSAQEPLQSFLCPIMQEVMTDPVCTIDGHCYEKKAISTWFEKRITSPLTGTVLGSRTLIPNHALRRAIHEWTHMYGGDQVQSAGEEEDAAPIESKNDDNGDDDDDTCDGEGKSESGGESKGAGQGEGEGEGEGAGAGAGEGRYERAVQRRSAQLERDLAEMRLVDDDAATSTVGGDSIGAGGAGTDGKKTADGCSLATPVAQWLQQLRVPPALAAQYEEALVAEGYDDVQSLMFLTVDELVDRMHFRVGHAQKAGHLLVQLQDAVNPGDAIVAASARGSGALVELSMRRPHDMEVQRRVMSAMLESILEEPLEEFDSFAAYRTVRAAAYDKGARTVCQKFLSAGALAAVVQLLDHGLEDGPTVFRGVQALNLFIFQLYNANDGEGAERLRSATCVGPLITVLKRWYEDTLLLTYCCNSLVGLAYQDSSLRTEISRLGGIPPVVRALEKKLDSQDAVRWALTMLRNVGIYEENKLQIALAGGIELVLKVLALEHFRAHVHVCEGAFGVLWNISTNCEPNLRAILDAGGLAVVLNAVEFHTGLSEQPFDEALGRLHGAAILLLFNVSRDDVGLAALLETNCDNLMERVIGRLVDGTVREYAGRILSRLTDRFRGL